MLVYQRVKWSNVGWFGGTPFSADHRFRRRFFQAALCNGGDPASWQYAWGAVPLCAKEHGRYCPNPPKPPHCAAPCQSRDALCSEVMQKVCVLKWWLGWCSEVILLPILANPHINVRMYIKKMCLRICQEKTKCQNRLPECISEKLEE